MAMKQSGHYTSNAILRTIEAKKKVQSSAKETNLLYHSAWMKVLDREERKLCGVEIKHDALVRINIELNECATSE